VRPWPEALRYYRGLDQLATETALTTTRHLKGVGKTTRAILAEHGIFSVEELANAQIDQLIKIPGFGKSKATRMIRAAKYMVGEAEAQ